MAGRGTAGRPDVVGAAADDLYGLPLDEFTAARNERARQARASGDNQAAAAIGKLPKPSRAAWLANQLAREHAEELRPLLELGQSMRQATAALDAGRLRQASGQQRQLVRELVQLARRLAQAAGQAMSDATARDLEDTLHAALADEEAARQLAQGRLTSGLSRSGFPGIDASAGPVAASSAAGSKRAKPARLTAQQAAAARRDQLKRARQEEDRAHSDAAEAQRARQDAQVALTRASDGAREAADHVERLTAELDAAQRAQADAERAQRQARQDADRAGRAAGHAQRRLEDATARRKDLEG